MLYFTRGVLQMQENNNNFATSVRIPVDLLKTIKKSAAYSRRSISAEIIFILQNHYNSMKKTH